MYKAQNENTLYQSMSKINKLKHSLQSTIIKKKLL